MNCVIGPLILFVIILTLTVFGLVCFLKKEETFVDRENLINSNDSIRENLVSPNMAIGEPWRKSPHTVKLSNGKIVGTQSPGSVFICNDMENCPNIVIKGCDKSKEIVNLRDNLPLGWGSTMTGPYAQNNCMSNVNGINKPSMRNPYGKVYPEGDQMYGFCEKGTPNAFEG